MPREISTTVACSNYDLLNLDVHNGQKYEWSDGTSVHIYCSKVYIHSCKHRRSFHTVKHPHLVQVLMNTPFSFLFSGINATFLVAGGVDDSIYEVHHLTVSPR